VPRLSRVLVGTDAYFAIVNMDTGEVDRVHEGEGPYIGASWDEKHIYALAERNGKARVFAFDETGAKVRDFSAGVTVGQDLLCHDGKILVAGDGVVVEHKGSRKKKVQFDLEPIVLSRDGDDVAVVCSDGAERWLIRGNKDPGVQIPDMVEALALIQILGSERKAKIILTSDGRYGHAGSQHQVCNSRAGGFAIYGATTVIGLYDPPSLVVIRRGCKGKEVYLPGASSVHIVRGIDVPDLAHLGKDAIRCPLAR